MHNDLLKIEGHPMKQATLFEKALGIMDPWYVSEVVFDASTKRLDILIDFKKGSLFHYESDDKAIQGDYKAYDTVEKEWRHLNFFQHECYLRARVPRVKTPGDETHLVMPSWSGLVNGFTLLFEALVLQMAKGMPVHQISQMIQISDHRIWKILESYIDATRQQEDFSQVTAIGIDETSVAKGHEYISLFVDLNSKKTLFITDGKDAATVEAFKNDFEAHQGQVGSIIDVSCDMSPAFIKGVKENLPQAEITFDKFHILKIINTAVDSVRREEAKYNPILKGARYVFLKNDINLTEKQRIMKSTLELPSLNLNAMRALHIRENFQQIYQASRTEDFEMLLNKWYFWATHSRLEPIVKAARTIKAHWSGVIRWKQSQINNGILEGLNSVIQAAKAKARGYGAKHFKTIAYLITSKLDFSKVNTEWIPT